MTYTVKESFYSIQGEGFHAGTPALFIRFAGCNVWSGRNEDRVNSDCSAWCDTDFVGGSKVEYLSSLVTHHVPLVVFTGGEPLLQLDSGEIKRVKRASGGAVMAVETNGITEPQLHVMDAIDWLCVSPKAPAEELALRCGDELKVVHPDYDPCAYMSLWDNFTHKFVMPRGYPDDIHPKLCEEACDFVKDHPGWRLTLQMQKVLKIR